MLGVEQTRVLRSKLLESLTDVQLARHKVVVGDASSFQACRAIGSLSLRACDMSEIAGLLIASTLRAAARHDRVKRATTTRVCRIVRCAPACVARRGVVNITKHNAAKY